MQQRSSSEASTRPARFLVPAMLNRRRISLKRILNRYMGLPFTQSQPLISCDDVCEAGLGDAFYESVKEILPLWKKKQTVAEAVDIEVDGIAIALDEEISFSYYRYLSLQSPIYSLPLLPDLSRYQAYCKQHMQQDDDAHSAVSRVLRKRALHDFMQDMLPVVHHVPIIRLSVYDSFSDGTRQRRLGDILAEDDELFYSCIAAYVSEQMQLLEEHF